MIKKNAEFFVFILLLILLSVLFSCKKEETIILKLVVPSSANDWPLTWINYDLAGRFNKRTDNKYTIKVYPGGEIVKIPEYFNALMTEKIEIACSPWGFYSFIEPRLSLIETPFLLNNQQAGAYTAKKLLPLYDKIFQEKLNQKGLGLMSISGVELITIKPVRKMQDWQGLLIGSLSPSTSQLAKILGGAPAIIDWVDFSKALNEKTIDGALSATHGAIQTKLTEVCKYLTLFYGVNSWNGWSINLDTWNKMPKKIQRILQEEVTYSVDWMHKTMIELDADDLKMLRKLGTNIYVLPPAERERWAEALSSYVNKQFSGFDEFGKQVRKVVDEANAKYPYTGILMENLEY